MGDEESFPLRIWSGLFKKKHWDKMGNAIWLFGMLIDKVTKEENGEGYVLGGKPVNYYDFKKEMPVTRKQYNRYMQILRDEGYIHTRKSARGLTIVIHKSKKFVSRSRDKNVPTIPHEGTILSPGRDKNVPTAGTKMSPPIRDNTVDITKTGNLLSEKKLQRYFACLKCQSVIMIEDNEYTDQVISSPQGLCSGFQGKSDLSHEPMKRVEITQIVRSCQSKNMDKQQIRTIVNKHIEGLQNAITGD